MDKGGYRGLTQTDRYGRIIPKAAHGTIRFDAPTNLGSTCLLYTSGQGVVFFYDVCHQTQIVPDQFFPCGRVTGTQCGKDFSCLLGREGPRKAAAFQMKRQNQKLCGKKLQKR